MLFHLLIVSIGRSSSAHYLRCLLPKISRYYNGDAAAEVVVVPMAFVIVGWRRVVSQLSVWVVPIVVVSCRWCSVVVVVL